MQKLRNVIPSANTLFAFEAAARLQSFTKAAEELNVSQPAISHAIRTLEESLGVSLFYRAHRRIELTGAGQRFLHDVSIGMEHIYHAARDLQRAPQRQQVTISTSSYFMNHWLLPGLDDFKAKYPEVDLRLHSTDRDLNLMAEGIDLSVRLGDGNWPEYDSTLFAEEVVYPVCSREYLEEMGTPRRAGDLQQHRLLHLDEPFRIRRTWKEWFRHVGIEEPLVDHGVRFNDALICLQAARSGQGVALGWHHVVGPLVEKGDLIRPVPDSFTATGSDFYLLIPKARRVPTQVTYLRDWILEEARRSNLPL